MDESGALCEVIPLSTNNAVTIEDVLVLFRVAMGLISLSDVEDETRPTDFPKWLDADSPLALGIHPRLLFIPQSYRATHPNAVGHTVQEMRNKLNEVSYSSLFQGFINEMDAEYGKDLASLSTKAGHHLDETYNAINFSFFIFN